MSLLLAIKLFASPLLIGLASLAGKRWGPGAAGLVGGLPLVAGPIMAALWISQGQQVVIDFSLAAPVGVWATIVYLLTVGFVSARWGWYLTIPFAWLCYLASAVAIHAAGLSKSLVLALTIAPALWIAATRILPRPSAAVTPAHLPHVELFARMLVAVFIVLTLTTAANWLGPEMTGVLAGGPVAATVIPAFIMSTSGRDPTLLALRGFLTGLIGFVVFFLIVGYGLQRFGMFAIFVALVASVGAGLGARRLMQWSMGQQVAAKDSTATTRNTTQG